MSNNSIKILAKVCPLIYVVSKWPKVMCFCYKSTFENLITNAKTSCPPFDIHKSKFVIVEWLSTKAHKIYNYLVFSTKPNRNSQKNDFLEGKTNLGHKCILNRFNQILSTNYKRRWFLTIKNPRSSKFYFYYK